MADILIKGMEMPTKVNHPLFIRISSDGHIAKGDFLKGGFIETEAKVVALPPHGDLKDMADIWDIVHRFFHGDCFEVCKLIRKVCPTIVEANYGTDS